MLVSNNAKKEAEFLKKFEKVTLKLLESQNEKIAKLMKQNQVLEKKIDHLSRPPPEASLREKLAFSFPYDQTRKFPAYIWQTWKWGLNDDRFGDSFKEGEMQWAIKNPGFVHELFNDDTSSAIVHHLYMNIPEIVEAYDLLPAVILKMDFFRYLILLAKGGVYADVDTYPLQPVPNWIPENVSPNEIGMVVGIEADPDTPKWRLMYARRLQFAQYVIQAKPGHPILREIVAKITENTLRKAEQGSMELPDSKTKHIDIMQWTGAGLWTDVIFTYFNDYVQSGIYSKITWKDFTKLDIPKFVSDILVLPITSFSPGVGSMGAGGEDHPLAFVKHSFGKLWQ
ncbi:glycosyltransferase family 32 protein [Babjeviella inositovora NRRL Y-12698]|uniref:Glycosyltransferase family 32 protein n=1 Tax=Babjeviella inositovora NRRL Y-12698 TaxID=984486 RepID=A0A1E3QNP0_9ASCO|nr:glycosyltransferase family 32 protein [Babjeviella inositovora NRRL Y-12698]ODQ79326.1 glycosyltransferase family 32 protein [Babjeviella inositovora NRRL Y-12698]